MPRYNHTCAIAFGVISNDPNGEDITPDMLRAALMQRLHRIDIYKAETGYDEMADVCLPPYDSFDME